jgi:carbamoyltransferase
MNILGISAFYHDSAAALLHDGGIVAAAQEERFTRRKHDASFPINAVRYCLAEGGVGPGDLDAVAFYDKPILKFARILEMHFSTAPRGLRPFLAAVPVWVRQKLWIPYQIDRALDAAGIAMPDDMFFPEHHQSHAASAFYPSPFEEAAVLTLDGVGEWATSTLGVGEGNRLTLLKELRFPHSLGLLYTAFTYFTGFKVNSGEYKMMGLAPYGEPRYADRIREHLVDLKEDGSFRLNMAYFGFLERLSMINENFCELFDGPPRAPETPIGQREMDIARSVQEVLEEIVLRMAHFAHETTGKENLCLAGGVALNCVANGRLVREGPFKDVWVQPASGDAGGALGCAQMVWHGYYDRPRTVPGKGRDAMRGSYLGPGFEDDEIEAFLEARGYPGQRLDPADWAPTLAGLIDDGKVVGLFQGRMEFGPRALGARSILGDARSSDMQSTMNLKIKFRESFRPFAPSYLEERTADYFQFDRPSPFMLMVADVQPERRHPTNPAATLKERVNQVRSDMPAITHVDYSARLQSVSPERNGRYYDLVKAFEERTGHGIVINTSFNVRGEPIVCTPEDAYTCFMRTDMDYLVLESFLLSKEDQPPWTEEQDWRDEYVLD